MKLIENEVAQYKTGGLYADTFPTKWLPAAIGILSEGFTEQNKFLNSTLKMVRGKITEHYKSLIDYLYTSEGKVIENKKILNALKKLLE